MTQLRSQMSAVRVNITRHETCGLRRPELGCQYFVAVVHMYRRGERGADIFDFLLPVSWQSLRMFCGRGGGGVRPRS